MTPTVYFLCVVFVPIFLLWAYCMVAEMNASRNKRRADVETARIQARVAITYLACPICRCRLDDDCYATGACINCGCESLPSRGPDQRSDG